MANILHTFHINRHSFCYNNTFHIYALKNMLLMLIQSHICFFSEQHKTYIHCYWFHIENIYIYYEDNIYITEPYEYYIVILYIQPYILMEPFIHICRLVMRYVKVPLYIRSYIKAYINILHILLCYMPHTSYCHFASSAEHIYAIYITWVHICFTYRRFLY